MVRCALGHGHESGSATGIKAGTILSILFAVLLLVSDLSVVSPGQRAIAASNQVTQPFMATADGVPTQTVYASGCSVSPATFTGSGGEQNLNVLSSCTLTLALPSGYKWNSNGLSSRHITTCSSGTCTGVSDSYSAMVDGTYWTEANGWINVTSSTNSGTVVWRMDFRQSSSAQSIYFYMPRYSNTTTYSAAAFGWNWVEIKPNTVTNLYGGLANNRVIYDDGSVLVVGGYGGNSGDVWEDWVFWASSTYYGFEGSFNSASIGTSQYEQWQIGVDSISSGTYTYANINPSGGVASGSLSSANIGVQVTSQVISSCGCYAWMADEQASAPGTPGIGWVLTYNSQPWVAVSNGGGDGYGEMQVSEFISDLNAGPYYYLQPYSFSWSSLVYPFISNATGGWYKGVQTLAKQVYSSSVSSQQKWTSIQQGAQADYHNAPKYSSIFNRVGELMFNGNEWAMFDNMTTWGTTSSSFPNTPTPMYISDIGGPFSSGLNGNNAPAIGMTNATGSYEVGLSGYNGATLSGSATNGVSTTSAAVTLSMLAVGNSAHTPLSYSVSVTTTGISDKFNVTLTAIVNQATTAKQIWTTFNPETIVGKTPACTQVVVGKAIDCTMTDYAGISRAGILIDYISGNISSFATSGNTVANNAGTAYFYNATSPQPISRGRYTATFELWFHYGSVTNLNQLTAFNTYPTLAPETVYYGYNPLTAGTSYWFKPYGIFNSSAALPMMTQLGSNTYSLTNVGTPSGTYGRTVFLNPAVFASGTAVTGVSSYTYNPSTGNLTYTLTMPSSGSAHVVITSSSGGTQPVVQPITVAVMESGAPAGTYTVNGCSASPTTGTTGVTTSFTMASSCSYTISFSNSGGVRWGFIAGGAFSATSTLQSTCSSGTCATASFTTYYQAQLSVNGGNGLAYSLPSETSDGWYTYGDSLTVSSNGIWGRSSGTGTRMASWNLDGGASTGVATTGTVTTAPILMTAAHTVNFNSATQFQLTLVNSPSAGGTSVATTSPTISGDTGWYDSGTPVSVAASPSSGYTFSSWTGSGSGAYTGSSNPTSVTMNTAIQETAVFVMPGQTGSGPLALDGSSILSDAGSSTRAVTLTTSNSPDLIIALITVYTGSSSVSISRISSTHLTFTKRGSVNNANYEEIEEWYAIASSPLSSETITVTFSGSAYATGTIFGVSGANTASPFDSNSGLPKVATGNSGTAASIPGFTTSNPNDMVIAAYGAPGSADSVAAGSGYTMIYHGHNPQNFGSEYQIVSSTLSGVSVGFAGNTNYWAGIADAIAAAPATTSTVTQPIDVTISESGAPAAPYTVNGCNPSPTTGTTGTTIYFTMSASCSFTVSFSNSGGLRDGFISGGSFSAVSSLQTTCGSGTCSAALLSADYQAALTVNGGNGVAYSVPSETSDGWYKSGDSLTVSSNGIWGRSSGTGTRLVSWNLDGGSNTNVATAGTVTTSSVTMTTAHTVDFNSAIQYQIAFVNSPSSGGTSAATTSTTIPGDTGWYDSGTAVSMSAAPGSGYAFSTWGGSGSGSYSGSSNPASVNMNAAIQETAYFVSTSTVTQPVTLTLNENGVPTETFTISGCSPSPSTVAGDGSPRSITMTPGCAFTLVGSSSGGVRFGFISSGTFSISSSSQTTCSSGTCNSISLSYDVQNHLTVNGGAGVTYSVTSETGDGWYKYGDSLAVSSNGIWSRSSGTGYRVASWNIDGDANTNVATASTVTTSSIVMTAARTVNFNQATQYQLTVSPGTGGTATATTSPTIPGDTGWYDSGTGVQVSATANIGYVFASWSGSGLGSYSGTNNPATATMNAPITETASFSSTSGGLSVDGSTSIGVSFSRTATATLTTSHSPDVIIALITVYSGSSSITISSISSTHLTFTERGSVNNANHEEIEEWYAIASSPISSETITVTFSGTAYATGTIFGISGANTASPFDSNSGSPKTATGNSGTAASISGFSTSNANDMIIAAYGAPGSADSVTVGSGYTMIYHGHNPQNFGSEYQVVSSTQSSVTLGFTGNTNYWAAIVDAVEA